MDAKIIDTMATTARFGWPKDMEPLIDQVVDALPHPSFPDAYLVRVKGCQRLMDAKDLAVLESEPVSPEHALRQALPALYAACDLGLQYQREIHLAERALGVRREEVETYG